MSYMPKILICDDEPSVCDSLKALLDGNDYKVHTANTGREAIDCLSNNAFDLALLDIVMPDMDGYLVMDHIDRQSPDTLVIIITGHASTESAVEALRKGAYDYLRKPFDYEELLKTIENALDRKRLEMGLRRLSEKMLRKRPKPPKNIVGDNIEKLVQELEAHRIELEAQNEEMRKIQQELELERNKYSDLYDFAPVGYFTVSENGLIQEANLTGASMLGFESGSLIGKPFSHFIVRDDQDVYNSHRKELLENWTPQTCELRLIKGDGTEFHAQLETKTVQDADGHFNLLRIAIMDVTSLKQTEEKLQKRTHDLGERVKELNCLYEISHLVEKPNISLEEILQGTVDLIPPSWQYPKIACARLILEDREWRTKNFRETIWKQTSAVKVHGQLFGAVEVYYLEERPESDEGPFLKEERSLITAIAGRLGRICKRKKTEEELIRLASIPEQDPNPIIETDLEGRVTYLNQAATEQFPDLSAGSIDHPVLIDLESIITKFERGRKKAFVRQIEIGDSHYEQKITYVSESGLIRIFAHDLTERVQMEEALQEAKTLYEKTLASLDQAVFVVEPATRTIVSCNPALERIFGYVEKETIGRITEFLYENRKMYEDFGTKLFTALDSDGVYKTEYRMRRKDGTVFNTEHTVTEIVNDSGQRIGVVGVVRNIDERKQAEEALRKAREELERRIQERTSELTAANRKLKQKMEERKLAEAALQESQKELRLLYSLLLTAQEEERKRISRDLHDGIGQGLATLNLNSKIIRENCSFTDQGVKQIIERNTSLMSDLIEDLRKITSGLRPEMLDHLGIIPTLEWYTQNFSQDFGIQIHLKANGFQSRIDRDMETSLYRIIQEALNNVAKHANAKNVRLTLSNHHTNVIVQIEDDGKGFDPIEMEKKGNGLGLVGLRERVGIFNGSFSLDSAPGKGSRIRIEMNS